MHALKITTSCREELLDITSRLAELVREINLDSGILTVFSPHTTAGVTINEGADPDVCRDILRHLKDLVPQSPGFRHAEGNSDAHIKTSLVGSSVQIIVHDRNLRLGAWQKVFLAEFDGPRTRQCWVHAAGSHNKD